MLPHDEYYDEMTEEEKLFEKKVTARIKLIEEEHVRENELQQRQLIYLNPKNLAGLKSLFSELYVTSLKKESFRNHLEAVSDKYEVLAGKKYTEIFAER